MLWEVSAVLCIDILGIGTMAEELFDGAGVIGQVEQCFVIFLDSVQPLAQQVVYRLCIIFPVRMEQQQ